MWVLVFVLTLLTSTASAQQAEGLSFLGPYQALSGVRASYRGSYGLRSRTNPSSPALGTLNHDGSLFGTIWSAEDREVSGVASIGVHDFVEKDLRATRRDFPQPLWNVSGGPAFRRKLSGDRMYGANLSVGSASDKPFNSLSEMAYSTNLFYRMPLESESKSAFVFILNYSNNRSFLSGWPLPGAAYWWEPNERFRAVVGVPFLSVNSKLTDQMSLSAAYFAPWVVNSQLNYKIFGPFQTYTGFSWNNQRYLLSGRTNDDERLFYEEKRVPFGVRGPISRSMMLDFSGTYSFDRLYFKGEKFRDRNDSVHVANGWIFSTQMSTMF